MLLFGHIGITIGIFFIIGFLMPAIKPHIKYRYVVFGSLLPDLIDKPIGRFLLSDSIASGRIFAHTMIFFFVLLLVSWYFYKSRNDTRMLIISGASFCHLIEDEMWKHMATFLWPLYGWDFPYSPSYGEGLAYFLTMLNRSFSLDYSNIYSAEFIGLIIIGLILLNSILKLIKKDERKKK